MCFKHLLMMYFQKHLFKPIWHQTFWCINTKAAASECLLIHKATHLVTTEMFSIATVKGFKLRGSWISKLIFYQLLVEQLTILASMTL